MSNIKVHYFTGYGRAEPIRMLLNHSKKEFEDIRYTFEEWGKIKPEGRFEFGQLPAVEVDGEVFTQSASVLRALGQMHGYYSTEPVTMWKIDSTIDALNDVFVSLARAVFNQNQEEQAKQFEEAFTNTLPKFFGILEKRLKDNSSQKRIVGDNLTIADFALAAFFYSSSFNDANPRQKEYLAVLEKFPTLKEYVEGLREDLKEHLEKRPSAPM